LADLAQQTVTPGDQTFAVWRHHYQPLDHYR
jgi:hypothetical protein